LGYAWNEDHPERSHWERAEFLDDSINPEDRPQMSSIELLADEISCLAYHAERANPRATALAAVTADYAPERVAARIPSLRRWLAAYQAALEECPTIEEP